MLTKNLAPVIKTYFVRVAVYIDVSSTTNPRFAGSLLCAKMRRNFTNCKFGASYEDHQERILNGYFFSSDAFIVNSSTLFHSRRSSNATECTSRIKASKNHKSGSRHGIDFQYSRKTATNRTALLSAPLKAIEL